VVVGLLGGAGAELGVSAPGDKDNLPSRKDSAANPQTAAMTECVRVQSNSNFSPILIFTRSPQARGH
jgi:hypothetical protein